MRPPPVVMRGIHGKHRRRCLSPKISIRSVTSVHIGTVATLDDAVPALNPTERRKGKTVIRVRP
jgi:hypothetical protein